MRVRNLRSVEQRLRDRHAPLSLAIRKSARSCAHAAERFHWHLSPRLTSERARELDIQLPRDFVGRLIPPKEQAQEPSSDTGCSPFGPSIDRVRSHTKQLGRVGVSQIIGLKPRKQARSRCSSSNRSAETSTVVLCISKPLVWFEQGQNPYRVGVCLPVYAYTPPLSKLR